MVFNNFDLENLDTAKFSLSPSDYEWIKTESELSKTENKQSEMTPKPLDSPSKSLENTPLSLSEYVKLEDI